MLFQYPDIPDIPHNINACPYYITSLGVLYRCQAQAVGKRVDQSMHRASDWGSTVVVCRVKTMLLILQWLAVKLIKLSYALDNLDCQNVLSHHSVEFSGYQTLFSSLQRAWVRGQCKSCYKDRISAYQIDTHCQLFHISPTSFRCSVQVFNPNLQSITLTWNVG